MREPPWLFRRRITHQNCVDLDALPFIKSYLRILLKGLDFLHSQAHVIHTGVRPSSCLPIAYILTYMCPDLKLDNIMVTFEDPSTIETFAKAQATHPMARKHLKHHTIYRCHNDFGPVFHGVGKMIPQITDFGHAQWGDKTRILMHPIQPDEMRAPEVLLGIGWSYSADMWNFGAMVRSLHCVPSRAMLNKADVGALERFFSIRTSDNYTVLARSAPCGYDCPHRADTSGAGSAAERHATLAMVSRGHESRGKTGQQCCRVLWRAVLH